MLAAPFVFVIASSGLANRNPDLPRAAASLGASARTILWRIELPLLRPSLVAGFVIALAYSLDEIIVAYFLLPPGEGTLPVQILRASHESAGGTVAAASMVVIAIAATSGAAIAGFRLLVRAAC